MTEMQLAYIEERRDYALDVGNHGAVVHQLLHEDIPALLEEIGRLNKEVAALQNEISWRDFPERMGR